MNKKIGILVSLVAAVILTGYSVSGTYAKYTSTAAVAGTAQVAAWNIAFTDGSNEITDGATFDLGVTADNANTIDAGLLAPGTTGSFTFGINSTGTQVAFSYGITFTVENKPTNLKFYSDDEYNTEITSSNDVYTVLAETEVAADDEAVAENQTVYWKWDFGTTDGDEDDTNDGVAAQEMTVNATLTATQLHEVA